MFALVLLAFTFSCATIPLYPSEIEENSKSIEKHPGLIDFYNEGLKQVGRTAIAVKVIKSQSSDVLKRQFVKSRKDFSNWTRFKRGLFGQKITREEMNIYTEIF